MKREIKNIIGILLGTAVATSILISIIKYHVKKKIDQEKRLEKN